MEYYAAELELNAKFHTFTTNCSKVHSGHNTVGAQIKYRKNKNRGSWLCVYLSYLYYSVVLSLYCHSVFYIDILFV